MSLADDPMVATHANMAVRCVMADGSDPATVVDRATSSCFISNTLTRGVSVEIAMAGA